VSDGPKRAQTVIAEKRVRVNPLEKNARMPRVKGKTIVRQATDEDRERMTQLDPTLSPVERARKSGLRL